MTRTTEWLVVAGIVSAIFQQFKLSLYCFLGALFIGALVNAGAKHSDWRKARQEFTEATAALVIAALFVGIIVGAIGATVALDLQGGW